MRTAAEIIEGFCDGYASGIYFFCPPIRGEACTGGRAPACMWIPIRRLSSLALALADFAGGIEEPHPLRARRGTRDKQHGLDGGSGYIVYFPNAAWTVHAAPSGRIRKGPHLFLKKSFKIDKK